MFNRIVSHLSLSPSAVAELAFYGRRLRKEKITRTFSAIAAVLVVGLQFATIAVPPAPTNAASPNDIVYGGIVSKDDMLNKYDASSEFKALYTYYGITRADITRAKVDTINSSDHSLKSIGRIQHTASDTEIGIGSKTYYGRPLHIWDTGANVSRGSNYKVLIGTRSGDNGYFAIMFHCGNIVYKTLPPKTVPTPPPKPTPTPKPSPTPTPTPTPSKTPKPTPTPAKTVACVSLAGNVSSGQAPVTVNFTGTGSASGQTVSSYNFNFGDGKSVEQAGATTSHTYQTVGTFTATLLVKGSAGTVSAPLAACSFTVTTTALPPSYTKAKAATNLTQNIDATEKPAQAGDQIRYSLTTKNIGGKGGGYVVVEHLEDVLEYADVTDTGGATLTGGVLTWPQSQIAGGASLIKSFVVTVKNPIPATPVGLSDKFSYDLRLDNLYGNGVSISLEPPVAKQVEGASTSLPQTGAGTSTVLVLVVAFMALFFYLRNRQLITEIKLLRGSYEGGLS